MRLRGMLTLPAILLLAAGLLGCEKKIEESRTEPGRDAVIAEIEKLAGTGVEYDEKSPDRPIVGIDFGMSFAVTDDGLEFLKGLTSLQRLNLSDTKVTDAGLEYLKGLTSLQTLYLNDTKVTDTGLEHLKGLTNLQTLGLNDTQVTDEGLEYLKGLTSLQDLRLHRTRVTDDGVMKLQQALTNCKITPKPQ